MPIIENAIFGKNQWDFDVPPEHKFEKGDMKKLVSAVKSVLDCYECEVVKTSHWLDKERQKKAIFQKQVKKFFDSESHFVLRHSYGLLSAVSVILTNPFATVDVIVENRQDFMEKNKPGMDYLKSIGFMNAIFILDGEEVNKPRRKLVPIDLKMDGPFILTSANLFRVFQDRMEALRCSSLTFDLGETFKAVMSVGQDPYPCSLPISRAESSEFFLDMRQIAHDTLDMSFLCSNNAWRKMLKLQDEQHRKCLEFY